MSSRPGKTKKYFLVFLVAALRVLACASGIIPAHMEACEGPKESDRQIAAEQTYRRYWLTSHFNPDRTCGGNAFDERMALK
jgi:hypothetical protein